MYNGENMKLYAFSNIIIDWQGNLPVFSYLRYVTIEYKAAYEFDKTCHSKFEFKKS